MHARICVLRSIVLSLKMWADSHLYHRSSLQGLMQPVAPLCNEREGFWKVGEVKPRAERIRCHADADAGQMRWEWMSRPP